jgi:hypothetical protein
MEKLEITKELALELHKNANEEGKGLLEKQFGKETFFGNVTDKENAIFEAACKTLSEDPTNIPDVSTFTERLRKHTIADFKLDVIHRARTLNNECDWTNTNEYKYWAYFGIKVDKSHPSGFGFSYSCCDCSDTTSDVGSRFCFRTSKEAIEFADDLMEMHKDHILVPKQ